MARSVSNAVSNSISDAAEQAYLNSMQNMDSYNSAAAENIPNQKKLMKNWLEKRVHSQMEKGSEYFDERFQDSNNNQTQGDSYDNQQHNGNHQNGNYDNTNGHVVGYADSHNKRNEYLLNRTGTMRQLSQVSTVADTVIENSVIADVVDELGNRNNPQEYEFPFEEYSSDDEKGGKVKVKKYRGILNVIFINVIRKKSKQTSRIAHVTLTRVHLFLFSCFFLFFNAN